MANLFTDTITLKGYKTLNEITNLTFSADNTYVVQAVSTDNPLYIREGEQGKGFVKYDSKPFEWKYDGENDLYIGSDYEKTVYINISE